MKKVFVGTIYGLTSFPDTDNRFPNAKKKMRMGCVVPVWPIRRIALVYYCVSCTNARKKSGDKDKNQFDFAECMHL